MFLNNDFVDNVNNLRVERYICNNDDDRLKENKLLLKKSKLYLKLELEKSKKINPNYKSPYGILSKTFDDIKFTEQRKIIESYEFERDIEKLKKLLSFLKEEIKVTFT